MQHLAETGAHLAALTDGTAFKNWALLIIGNGFIIFCAFRLVGQFMKEEWGRMTTTIVAAVLVAGFVWFPDTAKTLLGDVWTKISGNT
ncbi:TcpD family membrane protein [Kitasatospora aureofaciens]|uniref:TcpD family membrane protein n=1 Tax=Kitasatospora aureofaciens TaxID=1894 RepID=UPI0033A3A76D